MDFSISARIMRRENYFEPLFQNSSHYEMKAISAKLGELK